MAKSPGGPAVKLSKASDIIERSIVLQGTQSIMFDRYAGDNNTQLEAHQKLYLEPGDSRVIGLPGLNIMSFLSAHNTNSAPKRLRDSRKFKKIADACLSFVEIQEQFIPFVRKNGHGYDPIRFGKFEKNEV